MGTERAVTVDITTDESVTFRQHDPSQVCTSLLLQLPPPTREELIAMVKKHPSSVWFRNVGADVQVGRIVMDNGGLDIQFKVPPGKAFCFLAGGDDDGTAATGGRNG